MNSMWLFVCAIFAVFIQINASGSDYHSKKIEAGKACEKELNYEPGSPSILETETVPTDEQQKCYLECIYLKLGIIKDGKLNKNLGEEWIKQRYGNDPEAQKRISSAFEACEKRVSVDPNEKCAYGRLLRECIFNSPEGAPLKVFIKN
uniref:Odorant binding protein 13 n=1 Tax=Drosicha corpulenta TaxID=535978 RepID=A0A0U3UC53_9HEMI|nr:odorant binding protein 13 [Drosicha corpulenta]